MQNEMLSFGFKLTVYRSPANSMVPSSRLATKAKLRAPGKMELGLAGASAPPGPSIPAAAAKLHSPFAANSKIACVADPFRNVAPGLYLASTVKLPPFCPVTSTGVVETYGSSDPLSAISVFCPHPVRRAAFAKMAKYIFITFGMLRYPLEGGKSSVPGDACLVLSHKWLVCSGKLGTFVASEP